MTPLADPSVDQYRATYAALEAAGRLPADAYARDLKRAALERFAAAGLPGPKTEAWKYTSVEPLRRRRFAPPDGDTPVDYAAVAAASLGDAALAEVVVVNGRIAQRLSRMPTGPQGLRVISLAGALDSDRDPLERNLGRAVDTTGLVFTDLNTALFEDGLLVHVGRGVVLDRPLHLLFVSHPATADGDATASAVHPRVLVVAEPGAELRIVETYVTVGPGTHFTNAVTEIVAEQGAQVDHTRIVDESLEALHVGAVLTRVGRDARVALRSLTFGARWVRNDVHALLAGEGAECELDGLYMASGTQHVDHHTVIDHAVPHGTSREHYKGVLDGAARGVFNGRVVVRPDAQKTASEQTNRNLLLSETARVDTKPELEIYADDVKCSHGATIGQLDDAALFYLRSRGLPEHEARTMLTYAFAAGVVEGIPVDVLRERIDARVRAWLPRASVPEAA